MTQWNFGDILDAIEPALRADAPALIHGERRVTWPEMAARSNNLAGALRARGAGPGAKVALYMRNRPEYGETMAACFKGRLTHVNINYRYTPDEVLYIFDDADAEVVVYGGEFRNTIIQLQPRLTKVRTYVEIGDPSAIAPFAEAYEALAGEGDGSPLGITRSPEICFSSILAARRVCPKGLCGGTMTCATRNSIPHAC